jgi:glycine C-acetyltransferase
LNVFNFLDEENESNKVLHSIDSPQGPTVIINDKEYIQLSSNNYLGFTNHPRLIKAAIEATINQGVGSGSVRTIAGTLNVHSDFEKKLASFKKTESALVFQSGFTTNQGVLSAILTDKDVVISDQLNHASIIDGIRLTKATKKVYRHVDMKNLEEKLLECESYRVKLIVTDGVFSMDGNIAPLPEIVELAEKFGAIVMVDDAHASGVLGEYGRGTVNHFNLDGRVHIQVGTLSKAIGVLGGYVAGDRTLIEYLKYRSRPFLFSTSHPPGVIAACREAIDVLQQEPNHIEKLWDNTNYFKSKLVELGFNTGQSKTPITPIMIGDDLLTQKISDELLNEGVFAQGILFPTVQKGSSRIRTIVTAEHSKEQLDYSIDAFFKIGRKNNII